MAWLINAASTPDSSSTRHRIEGIHNPAVYIFGCVLFHGSHHVHALINQHGIGVRSTDINS